MTVAELKMFLETEQRVKKCIFFSSLLHNGHILAIIVILLSVIISLDVLNRIT